MRESFARRKIKIFLVLSISAIVIGCGDTSLFMSPVSEPSRVTIHTLDDGQILPAGASIPVSLHFSPDPDGSPTVVVVVELFDADGELIADSEFETESRSGELPEIELPTLSDGVYTVRFSIFDDDETTVIVERRFFYVDGRYAIAGISAYPPIMDPNSAGIVRAHLDVPPGADPYVRWYSAGRVIGEGHVSTGSDTIEIQSPAEEGVHPIRVELIPFVPESGEIVSSALVQRSEIVVKRNRDPAGVELSPRVSYYSLLHFRGNFRDDGYRVESVRAPRNGAAIGVPRVRIDGEVFGYYLDGSSGIRLDELVLPFDDGLLSPFSLHVRFLPYEFEGTRRVFHARSDEQGAAGIEFEVLLRDDMHGAFTLSYLDVEYRSEFVPLEITAGAVSSLVLSIKPGVADTAYSWFVNGRAVDDGTMPLAIEQTERAGRWTPTAGISTIGGANGIIAIVDEFGVYFRDAEKQPAADADVFSNAMRAQYGESLVYAEGFESNTRVDDDALVIAGALVIPTGSTVSFEPFFFENEALTIEMEFERFSPGLELGFYPVLTGGRRADAPIDSFPAFEPSPDDGRPGAEIAVDTENRHAENRHVIVVIVHATPELEFRVNEAVRSGASPTDFEGLVVEVTAETEARLRSIVAHRTGRRFDATQPTVQ